MLPPIWPSDGVDSLAFWLALLMWCVFFIVMRILGKKNRPARRHHNGHGKKTHGKKTRVPEKENPSDPPRG